MRFAHKKIPKIWAFLYVLCGLPLRGVLVPAGRINLANTPNPRFYGTNTWIGHSIEGEIRSIPPPCRKVKRPLPMPCVLGLAASQHRNFCTAESKLYSFQR